ncbi:MAG TPA: polyamine ABC transporter substrate-binding protein [Methylocella sp.]|nr:polyamine ABC transporter substrate-binding protein [Methylocella sp.]
MMRVLLVAICPFWLLLSGGLLPAFGQERIVNIYGWGDYIDPRVIEDFTKETGIKVAYDAYDSDEILQSRLATGKTGFDVVIVSSGVLQRQIAAGLYLRLDKSKLPNIKTLWPEVMTRLAVHDPGNQFAVNYMWFTLGLAYNVEKAREIAGVPPADLSLAASAASPPAPLLNSWNILFKLENLKKFSSCGVDVLDSPAEVFAIALQYLRLDPASSRPIDLKRAADLLSSIQRDVKKFESTEYADALANGDICLAVGYSGESFHARDRAHESGNGIEVNYAIPKEGAPIVLDNLAIPKDAPHVEEAYAFIDYLLRPRIAARNTNFTHLANGVLASQPLIDKTISGNPSIYPDADVMQRLFALGNHDPATQKALVREWARIKAGGREPH